MSQGFCVRSDADAAYAAECGLIVVFRRRSDAEFVDEIVAEEARGNSRKVTAFREEMLSTGGRVCPFRRCDEDFKTPVMRRMKRILPRIPDWREIACGRALRPIGREIAAVPR